MSASGDGDDHDHPGRDEHPGPDDQPATRSGPVDDLLVDPRERRLRAGWRLAAWLLVVVIAAMVGVTIQVELAALASSGLLTALAAVAGGVFMYAIVTGVTVAFARRVDHRPAAGLGLGGENFAPHLGLGLVLGLAMAAVVFLVGLALDVVRVVDVLVADPSAGIVPGVPVEGAVVGDLGPVVTIALLLVFFVAVGVAEEVLVRGYVLTNLAEGLAGLGPIDEHGGIAIAILATGGLFGALHYANPHAGIRSAAMITAVGVVLGWTYAVSGDLGIPIGVHVIWNFSLGAVFGFPVSGLAAPASLLDVQLTGDPLLMGGSFGPEAGLVMVAPLVVAVVAVALWVRRTTGDVRFQDTIARYTDN